jgi:hypothetical protein
MAETPVSAAAALIPARRPVLRGVAAPSTHGPPVSPPGGGGRAWSRVAAPPQLDRRRCRGCGSQRRPRVDQPPATASAPPRVRPIGAETGTAARALGLTATADFVASTPLAPLRAARAAGFAGGLTRRDPPWPGLEVPNASAARNAPVTSNEIRHQHRQRRGRSTASPAPRPEASAAPVRERKPCRVQLPRRAKREPRARHTPRFKIVPIRRYVTLAFPAKSPYTVVT